ncbi:hypothetical protein BZJ19_11175 [Salinivibrio proteolyticus]|uniref:hypothetical protein n=1 Tax=Salinivibrio proteolyticus TaxID=334715 RepID=UPI000989041E|nr:hypothetical protein [Salinivibrio proteolyticus]OOF24451.1 hypothetical protein BZJ19_11175 [Salinivibrio proteolyticus]
MEFYNLENVILKILKRIMLLAIGSGLLGNAMYIYGLGYYQGYVEALGFEYNLFPIEWKDTLLWTYAASRELGVSSIEFMNKFTSSALLILLLSVYLISRIWMQLSKIQSDNSQGKTSGKVNFKLAKKIYNLRQNHIWIYRLIYVPFNWLLLKEQSFIAFAASYFFMVFLIFIPLFIIIWIYFPLLGVNHGELVAQKRLKYYENFLCGDAGDYWSQCLEINISELKNHKGLTNPIGRVIFKNGTLIAILTKEGPITLSMPQRYYYKPDKNPCYRNGCKDSKN